MHPRQSENSSQTNPMPIEISNEQPNHEQQNSELRACKDCDRALCICPHSEDHSNEHNMLGAGTLDQFTCDHCSKKLSPLINYWAAMLQVTTKLGSHHHKSSQFLLKFVADILNLTLTFWGTRRVSMQAHSWSAKVVNMSVILRYTWMTTSNLAIHPSIKTNTGSSSPLWQEATISLSMYAWQQMMCGWSTL